MPNRFPVSESESPKLKMEVKQPKTRGGWKANNARKSMVNKMGEELEEPIGGAHKPVIHLGKLKEEERMVVGRWRIHSHFIIEKIVG